MEKEKFKPFAVVYHLSIGRSFATYDTEEEMNNAIKTNSRNFQWYRKYRAIEDEVQRDDS